MTQKFTSAATAVNGKAGKLPAAFSKLDNLVTPGAYFILDYGCGSNTDLPRAWCAAHGCRYLPYDPFNQPDDVNRSSREMAVLAKACGYPVIGVCSNVLNVIDSDDAVQTVVNNLQALTNLAVVTVYEGDGKGTGRQTGPDQWQRNEKLRAYERFAPGCCTFRAGCMIIK